ncbi:BnaC03g15780D [Brassica napus]|uniref:(rape) hypothetical protein n=1 Tax=Brassica napus TaxID=3708 RepID=A0A078H1T6_BRANA|nr:unnamed protein product [Brassica napus]CDY32610.1 BnaC03g15780D [Brassica napus]
MGFHMFPFVLLIIFILHGSSYSHKGFYGFMKNATLEPTLLSPRMACSTHVRASSEVTRF